MYGNGWYGHDSVSDDASTTVVRLNPAKGIAVCVASKYCRASTVAAKLFGKSLPGYSTLTIPRPLSATAVSRLALASFVGKYRNAIKTLSIRTSSLGKLQLVNTDSTCDLTPADNDVFIVGGSACGGLPFLQFLRAHSNTYRYLWDSRRLYRNVEANDYE